MADHADEQIPLWEYLQDPIFKEWMKKQPTLRFPHPKELPWRVWAQKIRGGKWSKREFGTYTEAYKFLAKLKKAGFHDAAISARIQGFQPPVVKRGKRKEHYIPNIMGQHELHRWCPHCRRPTVFTTYTQHHAFSWSPILAVPRCVVCGNAWSAVKHY